MLIYQRVSSNALYHTKPTGSDPKGSESDPKTSQGSSQSGTTMEKPSVVMTNIM